MGSTATRTSSPASRSCRSPRRAAACPAVSESKATTTCVAKRAKTLPCSAVRLVPQEATASASPNWCMATTSM